MFEEELGNFEEIAKLGVGTAVIVQGRLTASPGPKGIHIAKRHGKGFRIQLTAHCQVCRFAEKILTVEIAVEGSCPSDYPLQKKRHSFEYLRTIAHLRPRTKNNLFL